MRLDDLDDRMRAFETAPDPCVLPGVSMVARLDGRNFNRVTGEKVAARRRRIRRDLELPVTETCSAFLRSLITRD